MDNPYESPTSQPQSRESIRSMWNRRLVCPNCGRPKISAGRWQFSYLWKTGCQNCGARSKIKISGSARWKFLIYSILLIGTLLIQIAVLEIFDPIVWMDTAMFNWAGGLWNAIYRKFGRAAQVILLVLVFLVVFVTPVVLLLWAYARMLLRMIAYHTTLVPVKNRVADERAKSDNQHGSL